MSSIDDKLYTVRIKPDSTSHLVIKSQEVCRNCELKPCIDPCPSRTYTYQEDRLIVSYERCLECGTCRLVCPYDNIDWKYPRGGYGISYKFG